MTKKYTSFIISVVFTALLIISTVVFTVLRLTFLFVLPWDIIILPFILAIVFAIMVLSVEFL